MGKASLTAEFATADTTSVQLRRFFQYPNKVEQQSICQSQILQIIPLKDEFGL